MVRNRHNTKWFGEKTRHDLVLKRYKDSRNFGVKTRQIWCQNVTKVGAKTRFIFLKTWCENVKTWCKNDNLVWKRYIMNIFLYDKFWCQIVTIQIDLVWKRYIIWCESVTNPLLVRNRYNIKSLWNNFVW